MRGGSAQEVASMPLASMKKGGVGADEESERMETVLTTDPSDGPHALWSLGIRWLIRVVLCGLALRSKAAAGA